MTTRPPIGTMLTQKIVVPYPYAEHLLDIPLLPGFLEGDYG